MNSTTLPVSEERIAKDVISKLALMEINASWEYPGFIRVPVGEMTISIGTVNGPWGADVVDGAGHPIEFAESLAWRTLAQTPAENTDPAYLALAIQQTVASLFHAKKPAAMSTRIPVVTLEKIKYFAPMSKETSCFTADVYIDGEKAGSVENEGHGGPDNFSSHNLYERLGAIAKLLPENPEEEMGGRMFRMPHNPDTIVGALLDAYLIADDLRKAMKKKLLFTKPGEPGKVYQTKNLSPHVMKIIMKSGIKAVQTKIPGSDQILNFLPFEEALALYKAGA